MLQLSLLIAGAIAFNFGGYKATETTQSESHFLALESVHWIDDLGVNLEHYTYAAEFFMHARRSEQWIIKDTNNKLLALSDIK